MMHKLSFALVLLVICQFANGQKILPGQCKPQTKVPDFDVPRYLGLWYEFGSYPNTFQKGQKCVTALYGLDKDTVTVHNAAIDEVNNTPVSIDGTATVVEPGALNVKFLVGGVFPQTDAANYYVVSTNYTDYSVVLNCNSFRGAHAQFAWGLTRERFPSEETIAKIYEVLDANQVSRQYFQITNQNDCDAVSA